jgi:hypothetical protein
MIFFLGRPWSAYNERRLGHFPFAFRVPSNTLSLLARLRTEVSVRFNFAAIAAALLPDIARACS